MSIDETVFCREPERIFLGLINLAEAASFMGNVEGAKAAYQAAIVIQNEYIGDDERASLAIISSFLDKCKDSEIGQLLCQFFSDSPTILLDAVPMLVELGKYSDEPQWALRKLKDIAHGCDQVDTIANIIIIMQREGWVDEANELLHGYLKENGEQSIESYLSFQLEIEKVSQECDEAVRSLVFHHDQAGKDIC